MSAGGLVSYGVAVAFWLFTAAYSLLSSREFAVEQFLKPGLFPPLVFFASLWPLLSAAGFAQWAAPRVRQLRDIELATTTTATVWVMATIAVPVLGGLASITGGMAMWLCAAALLLLRLIASAEHPQIRGAAAASEASATSDFASCIAAAAVMVAIEMMIDLTHGRPIGEIGDTALLVARTQVLAAMMAFLILTIVRGLAAGQARPVVVEARIAVFAVGMLFGWFIDASVLTSLSIGGTLATVAAYVSGYVIAFVIATPAMVAFASKADGVRSMAAAFAPAITVRAPGLAGWMALLFGLAFVTDAASRIADWNFVLSRLGVLLAWLCALGAMLRFIRLSGTRGAGVFIGVAAFVLIAHVAVDRFVAPLSAAAPRTPASRWAVNLMRPAAGGPSELFELLPAHTNIAGDGNGTPVDVNWSTLSGAPSAVRPNIFVFVVDSLRRDYLSPYNDRVTFTPAIASFAAQSTTFSRAFTQYGATGLSVPSIWTGGSVLHKQYVTPYAPMNALAKLLTHEQYEQWISVDNIIDVIVPKTDTQRPLDQNRPVKDFRFCTTLDEVRGRLASRTDTRPLFVYSLPQDIHISVITREGARSIDDQAYAGFNAPVASRVRRFDACFGAFVDDLKGRGLFDESIIVLTSDHGDSLGEEGRIGHAYTLYPEIARVPMIVHVPVSLRDRFAFDPARVAYTTDLTPTLYRLLGHTIASPGDAYGESLARDPSAPAVAPRDRMIASSYGSVYGAVLKGGSQLYVADAIERREMAFSIGSGADPGRRLEVNAALRREGSDVIRTTVDSLARAYQFSPR